MHYFDIGIRVCVCDGGGIGGGELVIVAVFIMCLALILYWLAPPFATGIIGHTLVSLGYFMRSSNKLNFTVIRSIETCVRFTFFFTRVFFSSWKCLSSDVSFDASELHTHSFCHSLHLWHSWVWWSPVQCIFGSKRCIQFMSLFSFSMPATDCH